MKKYIRNFKKISVFINAMLLISNVESCFASGGGVVVASTHSALPTADNEEIKHLTQKVPMSKTMTENQIISLIDSGENERAFSALTQAYDNKRSFLFQSPYLLKEYAHMLLDNAKPNLTDLKICQAVDLLISSAELEINEEGELEARNFLISYVPNASGLLDLKSRDELRRDFVKAWNSTKKVS